MSERIYDLAIIGSGPTGLAIGAEAVKAGLDALVLDQGPLTAAIQAYPTFMRFFTTRDRLDIAGIPFAVPEDKPSRQQALAYYASVAASFEIPLALHEEVVEVTRGEGDDGGFVLTTRPREKELSGHRRARAVALATGYFFNPSHLGVPGEDQPWVRDRYLEPYPHYGERVVVVGGGNSAAEAALDLWRNGARVTLVHRGGGVKGSTKYWLKPDIENRIAEGSIGVRWNSRVTSFGDREVEIEGEGGSERLPADAAYVLIGYEPDADLQRRSGIEVDAESLVPIFDPDTCESNVPGLYIAGTLQAGRDTGKLFIENTRDHGAKIVGHLLRNRGAR